MDSLLLEGTYSPYTNISAIRKEEENSEMPKAILEALQLEQVKHLLKANMADEQFLHSKNENAKETADRVRLTNFTVN